MFRAEATPKFGSKHEENYTVRIAYIVVSIVVISDGTNKYDAIFNCNSAATSPVALHRRDQRGIPKNWEFSKEWNTLTIKSIRRESVVAKPRTVCHIETIVIAPWRLFLGRFFVKQIRKICSSSVYCRICCTLPNDHPNHQGALCNRWLGNTNRKIAPANEGVSE